MTDLDITHSTQIDVATLLAPWHLQAIRGVKLLTPMHSEWDCDDIGAAMLVLDAGIHIRRSNDPEALYGLSPREDAIGKLYFWLNCIPQLDGGVFPHPKHALSACLAEMVNDVWAHAPELVSPGAHWSLRTSGGIMDGYSLADTFALLCIVLDPAVLDPDPKAVIDRHLQTKRCIDIAASKGRYGVLLEVARRDLDSAARIYALHSRPADLAALAHTAGGSVVSGPGYVSGQVRVIGHSDEVRAPMAMAAQCARDLLSGMVESGTRCTESQVGWCAARPTHSVATLDFRPVPAIKSAVISMLRMGAIGHSVCGYNKTIRDIGTVVGYATTPAGDRELATDFAGAVALELLSVAKGRWPRDGSGRYHRTAEFNPAIMAMLTRNPDAHSSAGDGSFFGGLMQHFIDAGIGVDAVVCLRRVRDGEDAVETTLRAVLDETMPPGTAEAYAATFRARIMADVIDAAADAAASAGTGMSVRAPAGRRARMGV